MPNASRWAGRRLLAPAAVALAGRAAAQPIPPVGQPLPARLGAWDFRYSEFTDSTTAEGPSDDRMGRYVQLQLRQRGRARTDSLDVRLYFEDKGHVLDAAFFGNATARATGAAAQTVGAAGAPFKPGGPVYFVWDSAGTTVRAIVPVTDVAFDMRGDIPVYRGWATLAPEFLARLVAVPGATHVRVQAWDDKVGRFEFPADWRAAALVALQIVGRAP